MYEGSRFIIFLSPVIQDTHFNVNRNVDHLVSVQYQYHKSVSVTDLKHLADMSRSIFELLVSEGLTRESS